MVIETHTYIHRRGRVGLFECECGCGQTFFADYKTRQPRYYNKAHRARAYRARARARVREVEYWEMNPTATPEAVYHAYEVYLQKELRKNRGKM